MSRCSKRVEHADTNNSNLNSPIVTISVGQSQRLFAAHEEVLKRSPFFAQACKAQFFETAGKRIELLTEEPEVFSAVLEFLYKGDYSPRLLFDKKGGGWTLEADGSDTPKVITYQRTAVSITVLKDTAIYVSRLNSITGPMLTQRQCSAHRYGMPELQRVALKKQGLQSNVSCSTILSSARFAYANTPPSDSKLRAHYLALIIRSRNIFKRSGTMQAEMKVGGTDLFFDLFVALVNHLVGLTDHLASRLSANDVHRTTSPQLPNLHAESACCLSAPHVSHSSFLISSPPASIIARHDFALIKLK